MSNRTSPNELVRQRYAVGRRIIPRDEGRKLTQREFLDVGFGNNPRTGKPYNTRTLRKWLSGERDASKAVEHSMRDTYSFQQRVQVGDQTYGPVLTKPSGRSGLDLFTPTGRKRILRAAKERLTQRQQQLNTAPYSTTNPSPELKDLRSLRGTKLTKARAVAHTRRPSVIITRKAA